MNRNFTARIKKSAQLIILLLLALVFAFPFYWMFSNSIKLPQDIFLFPPELIPFPFGFDSYREAWSMQNFTLYTYNSFKIVFLNIIFAVGASAIVAYGFARLRFRGRELLFAIVLATLIVPNEVLIIPQYVLFNHFGWLNTHLPLIIPFVGGNPIFIFLIRQYLKSIPYELDEAAIMDGCNRFQIFYRILLPLLVPVLVTASIFQFMMSWNDFMGPLIYLQSREYWTLALGVASVNSEELYSSVHWGHRMALTTIYSIVPLIVFFVAQKKLIGGIATTGIKG